MTTLQWIPQYIIFCNTIKGKNPEVYSRHDDNVQDLYKIVQFQTKLIYFKDFSRIFQGQITVFKSTKI